MLVATFTLARSARAVEGHELLRNGGFDESRGELPADWYPCFIRGRGARLWRNTDSFYSSPASVAIEGGPADGKRVATNWAQRIDHPPSGRTVRLTAYVRTEAAEAANVCIQAWDGITADSTMVGFASTSVLTGDHDWTLLESRPLNLPRSTALVVVRAALTGAGKAWFDEIHLLVDDSAEAGSATKVPQGAAEAWANESAQATQRVAEERARAELAKLVDGRIVRAIPLVKDAMVIAYLPDWAHNHVDWFGICDGGFAGESPMDRGGVRALIEWPAPSQQDIAIPGRRFWLALYARRVPASAAGPVLVYPVIEAWPEATSWKHQPAYADEPAAASRLSPEVGWKLLDVTAVVRAQVHTPEESHGVLLRFGNEDHVAPKISTFEFASREAEGEWAHRRPILLVVDPLPPSGSGNP
jgi:hypothetical protein